LLTRHELWLANSGKIQLSLVIGKSISLMRPEAANILGDGFIKEPGKGGIE
jgi:hypothetical protein